MIAYAAKVVVSVGVEKNRGNKKDMADLSNTENIKCEKDCYATEKVSNKCSNKQHMRVYSRETVNSVVGKL